MKGLKKMNIHKTEKKLQDIHKQMNRITIRTMIGEASAKEIAEYDELLTKKQKLLRKLKQKQK